MVLDLFRAGPLMLGAVDGDEPYVQIYEELEREESPRFSARMVFGEGDERGPEGVPIDEALGWGRARSRLVLVLLAAGGGTYFSAGDGRPEQWEVGLLLPWPHVGGVAAARQLAVRAGAGFAGRGARSWFVILSVEGEDDGPDGFIEDWREALESDPAVLALLGTGLTRDGSYPQRYASASRGTQKVISRGRLWRPWPARLS